jgi:hypothetical protein
MGSMYECIADLHDEPAFVGQLRDVDDDGTVREIEEGVPVDRQVVRRDNEPVLGGFQPVELPEAVAPSPFRFEGSREGFDAVRERIAPQPGLHSQRVGILLAFVDRHVASASSLVVPPSSPCGERRTSHASNTASRPVGWEGWQ